MRDRTSVRLSKMDKIEVFRLAHSQSVTVVLYQDSTAAKVAVSSSMSEPWTEIDGPGLPLR